MSADNGIYILKTKGLTDGTFEFRVAHAQAIEKLNWDPARLHSYNQNHYNEQNAVQLFGECKVHATLGLATVEAVTLEREYEFVEYGVCLLDRSDQMFQSVSVPT